MSTTEDIEMHAMPAHDEARHVRQEHDARVPTAVGWHFAVEVLRLILRHVVAELPGAASLTHTVKAAASVWKVSN